MFDKKAIPQAPTPTSFNCPDCNMLLSSSDAHPVCPHCSLPLTGATAGQLWQTQAWLYDLTQRRTELLVQLRTQRDALLQASTLVGANQQVLHEAISVPKPRESRNTTPQRLLLIAATVLLLVASMIFLAVTWAKIDILTQGAIVIGLSLISGLIAKRLMSSALTASAQALGTISSLLLIIAFLGAKSLGLKSLDGIDASLYTSLSFGTAALVAGLFQLKPPSPSVFRFLIPIHLAISVTALSFWFSFTEAYYTAAIVCTAVYVMAILLNRYFRDDLASKVSLAIVASITLLGAIPTFIASTAAGSNSTAILVPFLLTVLVALALLQVAGFFDAWHARKSYDFLLETIAILSVAGSVTALAYHNLEYAPLGISLACLLGIYFITSRLSEFTRTNFTLYALLTQSVLVTGLTLANMSNDQDYRTGAGVLVLLAISSALVSFKVQALHIPLIVGASVATMSAAEVFVGSVHDELNQRLIVTAFTAILGALLYLRQHRGSESRFILAPLSGFAVLNLSLTYAIFPEGGAPSHFGSISDSAALLAAEFALYGILALLLSRENSLRFLSILAVPLLAASEWTLAGNANVATLEAYTLPLAALALLAGYLHLRDVPTAPSWVTFGPATSIAFIPSAFACFGSDVLLRPLLVAATAALVLLLALRKKLQAPVITSSIALIVVALSQLGPWALLLPRWVTLGALGVLLLLAAIKYEAVKGQAQKVSESIGNLT